MPGFALVVPPTDLQGAKTALRGYAPQIAARCKKGQLVYACCRYGVVGATLGRHSATPTDFVQGKTGIEVLFWPQLHGTEHAVLEAIERFQPGDPDSDHRAEGP